MQSFQSGPWLKEEEDRGGGWPDSGGAGRQRRGRRGQGERVGHGEPVGVLEGVDHGLEEARRR